MKRRAAVTVLAAVAVLGAGCNGTTLPSGPPEPARAPRPPADDIVRALDGFDELVPWFRAWRDDIDSEPLYVGGEEYGS